MQLKVLARSTQNGVQSVSRVSPPPLAGVSDAYITATASYRTHPLILLNPSKPVPPHLAQKFAKCFSPGVVQVSADGEVRCSLI